MTLRFHGWKTRFLGLSAGALLCVSTGCNSDKQERRLPHNPAPINKPMGPGNTVMSPPTSPAFNNLTNNPPGVITQQPAMPATTTQNSLPPAMPSMPPIGSRPQMNTPTAQVPMNTGMNQANFNQPAAIPLPSPQTMNVNSSPANAYPIQQGVPGSPQMQVHNLQPQAVQPPMMQPTMPLQQQPQVQMQQNTPQYHQQMPQPPVVAPPVQLPQTINQMQYQQPIMQPQQMQPQVQPQHMILPGPNLSMKSNDQMQGLSMPGDNRAAVMQASTQLMRDAYAASQDTSSSMAPNVKVIAQNVRSVNDPSFRLPPDPVIDAPITVPTTSLGR